MNTTVSKSFGLALLLAVGILAVMVALGTFSAQKAGAAEIAANTVEVQPRNPAGGEATYIRVNFTLGSDASDTLGSGQDVAITLQGFDIPENIDASMVSIRSGAGATAIVARAAAVAVSDQTITLTVGNDGDDIPVEFANNAVVAVTITSAAGIVAPVVAGTYNATVAVGEAPQTTTGTGEAFEGFTISRTVSASPSSGDSSTKITVTGASFNDGTADIYVNNTMESGDTAPIGAKAKSVTVSGGKFTTTLSITVGVDTDKFQNGDNYIHVFDSAGTASTNGAKFVLNGKVKAPETLVKGTKGVTVKLTEATTTGSPSVSAVKIGGVSVPYGSTTDVVRTTTGGHDGEDGSSAIPTPVTDGTVDIKIDVLGTVGTGSKELALYSDAAATTKLGSTKVEITALALRLTPSTAVPGQTVDLDGSGFTGSGDVMTLMVGGEPVVPKPTNKATTNGRFFITFKVPDVEDGSHTVQLVDNESKIGEETLTVAKPTITIDPTSGRRGTSVTVTGTGFPASDSIIITYKGDDAGFARSDSSGNWDTDITVPPGADIGKESDIVAERRAVVSTTPGAAKALRKSDAVKHMVPESELTLSTTSAPSGETITITGTGFPPYSSITVEFGNNGASPAGGNTDENGDFTAEVQVPLLTPGTSHLVKVVVGGPTGKTITELFTIAATPVVMTIEDLFADLIDNDSLDTVWRLPLNSGEDWTSYTTNPETSFGNDLFEINSGDILYVRVTSDQTLESLQPASLEEGWNYRTVK